MVNKDEIKSRMMAIILVIVIAVASLLVVSSMTSIYRDATADVVNNVTVEGNETWGTTAVDNLANALADPLGLILFASFFGLIVAVVAVGSGKIKL